MNKNINDNGGAQNAQNTTSSATANNGSNQADTNNASAYKAPNIPAPLLSPYKPESSEVVVIDIHEKSQLSNPDICIKLGLTSDEAEHFSIILPPPNVTGTLHLGHGLMASLSDISIRFERMRGKRALWIPGTDHAAIATQSKVEKEISKNEGKSRYDLGREELLRRVEEFAQASHDTIVTQTKRMGTSLDWSREAYTLDATRNHAVRTMFKKMYDDGLIYQGSRIVNWDPKGQTTIADDEIVYKEDTSKFYYFKYGPFTIGTARPETKFGDKYVVMHPKDERYKQYEHGQKITVEWINGPIEATIIKDETIDMEFGTGVMTITPWHSGVDFQLAEKYKLDKEQIIDQKGRLLPIAGPEFAGMKISEAREKIVEKLASKGLVEKIEDKYIHNIATAERTGGTIEPQIMKQWFVAVNKPFILPFSDIKGIEAGKETTLKQIMRAAVDGGQVELIPEHYNKTYFHWIDNLNDWCISRQIWYGHRIPVWYKKAEDGTIAETYCDILSPKEADRADADEFVQDEDTLDTWFSSGLWTFSTMGWPEAFDTKTGAIQAGSDLARFHPTSILITGPDIIFFWVARMILMTGYAMGTVPYERVYFNGLVRDMQGRKMSKSFGNGGDPVEISEKYGADALRMFYAMATAPGTDTKLDENKIKGFKHFANKLWNITRFILTMAEEQKNKDVSSTATYDANFSAWSAKDIELIAERDELIKTITKELEELRYHLASDKIYQYTWSRFADIILEESKIIFNGRAEKVDATDPENPAKNHTALPAGTQEEKNSRIQFLLHTLRTLLVVVHPFMPHVTEELWSIINTGKSLNDMSSEERAKINAADLLMAHKWPN
ncbi:MAG: valine--tRNA ligase [Candidatus Pacebacteria bacterium]|nr:valine--tRNA ligase [Candidatus Paceibacterota bacterium]